MLFGCLLVALILDPSAHAAYRVDLNAPAPLKALLNEHLDLMRYREREDLSDDQLEFMIATVEDQVGKLAATEGYFSPVTTVASDRMQGVVLVRLTVAPGPRTNVFQVNLNVTGPAAQQSPDQAARVQLDWPLPAGAPFRQPDWSDAKEAGLQILQRRRYPAARIAASQALIDADGQRAELYVLYDSGPLFTFGAARISGTRRYPDSIIRNINPLRMGEPYSVDRLLEFQRQIMRLPYFSNVVIDFNEDATDPLMVPVDVNATEYPTQRLRAGAGLTSDTGAQIEGRYGHNNIAGRAWALEAVLRLEQKRQLTSIGLSLPPRPGGFVHNAHASTDRTTLEGIDLRSNRVGARRTRIGDRQDTSYSIEYYRDRLEQVSGAPLPAEIVIEPGAHQALVVGFDKTWRRVDRPAAPRRGRIINIALGAALKGLLTDQSFLRGYGRLRQYFPVRERHLVVLRAELGAVGSRGGNASIPASLLFRAGGTDSVRGYGFQSIGNERNGVVYPARFLATGGLEYQHWLSGTWGAAVFYDVGMAADRWSGKSFFHGIGVGARWASPVGRINADLAYGFQSKEVRPHLALAVIF